MPYTAITENGLQLWREDIFATREEAETWVAEHPLTPAGNKVLAVSAEQCRIIQTEVKRLCEKSARKLEADRKGYVALFLRNYEAITGDVS